MIMKEYKVFLMLTNFQSVNFGVNNGVCEAKSPMEAVKKQSPFPLVKVVKIRKEDTNKYRREAEIAKVVNDLGKESYYALYR